MYGVAFETVYRQERNGKNQPAYPAGKIFFIYQHQRGGSNQPHNSQTQAFKYGFNGGADGAENNASAKSSR